MKQLIANCFLMVLLLMQFNQECLGECYDDGRYSYSDFTYKELQIDNDYSDYLSELEYYDDEYDTNYADDPKTITQWFKLNVEQGITNSTFADYDSDGNLEAYFETAKGEYDAYHSIWYVDGHNIQCVVDDTYAWLGSQIWADKHVLQEILRDQWNDVYAVRKGEPILVEAPSYLNINHVACDKSGLYGVESDWDDDGYAVIIYHKIAYDAQNYRFRDLHEYYMDPSKKPTKKPTPKPTKKPTIRPTRKPTPKPTKKPTPRPTNKSQTKPTYVSLRKGDEGEAVRALQIKLVQRNLLYDPADGIFGTNTKKAIKQLQNMAGLPDTGVADRETQIALERIHKQFESQGRHRFMIYRIEYVRSEKKVYVYYKNIGDKKVKSFRCKLTERKKSKQENGDFIGNGKGSWLWYEYDIDATSGQSSYIRFNLYDGYRFSFDSGEKHTMKFKDNTEYACVCLMGYTTDDGRYHEVDGTNLYCKVP